MDKSSCIQMQSIPKDDCFIIDRSDNELWAISKELANLDIYKYDNDVNKWGKHEHNIENADELSGPISPCFDK